MKFLKKFKKIKIKNNEEKEIIWNHNWLKEIYYFKKHINCFLP